MEIIFRELIESDINYCSEIIKDIYTKESEKSWPDILRKEFYDVLNKAYPSKCLVAIINDKIVGMGCYVRVVSDDTTNIVYKLTWINIAPEYQRKKIGTKLIIELEKHIKKECHENYYVILETDKPDFYKQLSYYTYSKNGDNDVMGKLFPKTIHPKILIGTLFSDVKDYVIRDWFKNVSKLTYPNFDICLVDNSKNKKYHKKIFKHLSEHKGKSNIGKITVLHMPKTHRKSEVFMTLSASELRKHFLKNNYDFLLNLECDIYPPSDIIENLLSYNKSVIGATYFSGAKDTSFPMMMQHYVYNNIQCVTNIPYIKGFYEIPKPFTPKKHFGQGIGCVLIHNDIIKRIPFRSDPTESSHYDVMFYCDLLDNDITNYLAPIICRHENQTWDIQNKMLGN